MDILYMRVNYTLVGDNNFIEENPAVAIPYLTLISIFTLSGCIGNMMVIAAVLTYKVSFYLEFAFVP